MVTRAFLLLVLSSAVSGAQTGLEPGNTTIPASNAPAAMTAAASNTNDTQNPSQTPSGGAAAPANPASTTTTSAPSTSSPASSQAPSAQAPASTTPAAQVATTNLKEKVNAPTDRDLYCSGFITSEHIPTDTIVAGGYTSPMQTRFADRDLIYLRGHNLKEGDRFSIVRHVQDPNGFQIFRDKDKLLKQVGELYFEVGTIHVVTVRETIAAAKVDLGCTEVSLGDIAVPFAERERPKFRTYTNFDNLVPPSGKPTGRIILAKDFDSLIGTNRIVYLNLGADQGIKVGDYFRATRTYASMAVEPISAASYKATATEPERKRTKGVVTPYEMMRLTGPDSSGMVRGFPRMSLGRMVVLTVQPHSATAMVTYATEPIQIGDAVEMMEEPAAVPPPAEPPASAPPTITCTGNPPSAPSGTIFTINCAGVSPEGRPLTYEFETSKGHITPRQSNATLTTREVEPGPISVKATVTDDRNLSASTFTNVSIEAPPPSPTPSMVNSFFFKPNSARVDNAAKAILDAVALQLQRDTASTVALVGNTTPEEKDEIGMQRAENAKTYLTKEKGIDPSRVQTKDGGKNGSKVEIWILPPGSSLPQ